MATATTTKLAEASAALAKLAQQGNAAPARTPANGNGYAKNPNPVLFTVQLGGVDVTAARVAILTRMSAKEISTEQAAVELEALEATRSGKVYGKKSQKGGLSLYGLGQWPVTLYAEQWEKVLNPAVSSVILQALGTPANGFSRKPTK